MSDALSKPPTKGKRCPAISGVLSLGEVLSLCIMPWLTPDGGKVPLFLSGTTNYIIQLLQYHV